MRDITDELPFEIPESWEWVRMSEYLDVRDGTHDTPKYVPSGYPLITSKNLNNGRIDYSNVKYISETDHQAISQRSRVDDGDILFAMIGSIGNPVIVKKMQDFSIKNIALFKPLHRDLTYMSFVYYFLMLAQDWLRREASGGVQSFVSLKYFRNYLFPLPPFAEQQRIVARIEELLPHIDAYNTAEQKLTALNTTFPDALKKSILQAAIQGKLVLQDLNDEPASILLERIRAKREQLIKEGKIKHSKHESIIFRRDNSHYEMRDGVEVCIDDELPFEIPENWQWCRLGTLCSFGDCENAESEIIESEAWLLDLEDIEKDSGRLLQRKRKSEVKSLSTKHRFSSGQILYSKLRPYLNKVIVADEDGYCTSEILPLDFGVSVYNRYAQIYLMSPFFVGYANQCSYGVKMPRLGSQDGRNALVPLPPHDEQYRIVERIDVIMPLFAQFKH